MGERIASVQASIVAVLSVCGHLLHEVSSGACQSRTIKPPAQSLAITALTLVSSFERDTDDRGFTSFLVGKQGEN